MEFVDNILFQCFGGQPVVHPTRLMVRGTHLTNRSCSLSYRQHSFGTFSTNLNPIYRFGVPRLVLEWYYG